MSGLDALWAVYLWLPTGFLIDLVILQFGLRWAYARRNR